MISDYIYINIELNEIIKQGAYGNCILFLNAVCNSSTLPRKQRKWNTHILQTAFWEILTSSFVYNVCLQQIHISRTTLYSKG